MAGPPAGPASAPADVRVWDLFVRVTHWSVLAGVVLAWFGRHGPGRLHDAHTTIGYVVLALVAGRIAWGAFAPGVHARIAAFVRSPAEVARYARALARGDAPRHLGHNPLGGWMIVLLWTTLLVVCGSGILFTTDRFWGVAWVEETHAIATYALFGLVAVHVGGVVHASLLHGENLVGAMWTGKKRAE